MKGGRNAAGVGLAGLLVGLGVAIFAKAVWKVGFETLTLEHMMGPGLVLVGLLRLKMARMMNGGSDGDRRGGDGDPS